MIIKTISPSNLMDIFKEATDNVNLTLSDSDKIIFCKNQIIKGDNCRIESLNLINLLLEIERISNNRLGYRLEIFDSYQDANNEVNFEEFSKIISTSSISGKK